MGARSHEEFERSYDVDVALEVPPLAGVAGIERLEGPELVELDAVYFDTPDLALARARVALRHRSGGADAGWHVKRAGASSRHEQQWPSSGRATEIPLEVVTSVAVHVGERELVPVATVRNTRRVSRLLRADGVAVAEFCDDRVVAVRLRDGRETRWREWEVELMAGVAPAERESVLDAIESRLLRGGAAPSASGSKLARALQGHLGGRGESSDAASGASRERERA